MDAHNQLQKIEKGNPSPAKGTVPWILDIGAFDGSYGLRLREKLGGDLPILMIEPDPENYKKIPDQEGLYKLNEAIASHDGTIDFYFLKPATSSVLPIDPASLSHYIDGNTGVKARPEDWKPQEVRKVSCRRLDTLCKERGIRHVRFLKIDTQGYDLEVIKSFGDDLAMVEELVCEVQLTGSEIYRGAATQQEILDYLHAKGFLWIRKEGQSYGQECNMYFKRKDLLGGLEKEPLISILTPSYKSGRFLEQCIQSALAQDYPFVELIVQDGASPDGTLEILKKYDGKIQWISEPDRGQSDGLNKALQRCKGDIIGVLNADDEYLSHAARWAVEQFARFPQMGAIYGQQQNINEEGAVIDESSGPDPYNFKKIFCCDAVIPAQAAFIQRKAWEQVGFYIDTTRKTCPDYELWVRLGMAYPMQYAPGVIARYRFHEGSEGQQGHIVHEMVKSKCEVVERIYAATETPKKIKQWRRRALAGIYCWSACHFLPPMLARHEKQAFDQWKKSFSIYPIPRVCFYLLSYVIQKRIFGPFVMIDPAEKFRKLRRVFREALRELDAKLLNGFFYQKIYFPRKKAKEDKEKNRDFPDYSL